MNVSTSRPQLYRVEHGRYIERCLTNGERPIIGIGPSWSANEATARSPSVRPKCAPNGSSPVSSETSPRRAQGRRLEELQSELVHVSRPTAIGEMASSIDSEINRPRSAITNCMRAQRLRSRAPRRTPTAMVMHSNARRNTLYAPKISSSARGTSFPGASTLWRSRSRSLKKLWPWP